MSQKVINLLNKYGPMLSGDLARFFEKEYGVSNVAARKALSRAKSPVKKIYTLSFEKNQKFFYLESQYMSHRYTEALLTAIKENSKVNWAYICALRSQNGYASKGILPVLVPSPIDNVKGHKRFTRVIEDLIECHIIEDYNETHWKLCDWVLGYNNYSRSVGIETVKKQIVGDFVRWARNINLIGYDSAKTFNKAAEFAHFQWAFTAPSYIQPLYDIKEQKPGFVIADVFYGSSASVEDIKFFLDKLAIIRSFKNLPFVLPIFIVESVTQEALMELKENKVVVAIIQNIFDQRYTELLTEIVSVFTNSSAIIANNPSKIESLFAEISKAEGRYNDIVGDMFELLVGYYYQQIGSRYIQIRKIIRIPNSSNINEIDILVERDGQIIIVECKATRSEINIKFVDKWLTENIIRIREWINETYPDGRNLSFQLWSLGGFTQEALARLNEAALVTKKYKIEFFDKNQILAMAKRHKVQTMIDVLNQHFHHPLEKSIAVYNKNNRVKRNNNK